MARTVEVVPSKGRFNVSVNYGEHTFPLGTVSGKELSDVLWKLYSHKGKTVSEETRRKISESKTGTKYQKRVALGEKV